MNKNSSIHIGEVEPGRWIAATGQSPYFCFEAKSEAALIKRVKEAVAFCREKADDLEEGKRGPTIQPFKIAKTISVRELEEA